MEKRIKTLIALLLLSLGLPLAAQAEPAPPQTHPAVIAIVDVQRLLQESLAAKSVQQQLETQRSKFQTEVAAEEAELRRAEQKLAKMRDDENQTPAYAQEEQKLRQRFLTVERQVQSRRKALDQAFSDSMNAVRNGIVEIVASVAKIHGVNLAVVKQQVIWNDVNIDITDEVLTKLNKAMPKLDVKVVPEDEIDESQPASTKNKKKTKVK